MSAYEDMARGQGFGMKKCPKCETSNGPRALKCKQCGTSFVVTYAGRGEGAAEVDGIDKPGIKQDSFTKSLDILTFGHSNENGSSGPTRPVDIDVLTKSGPVTTLKAIEGTKQESPKVATPTPTTTVTPIQSEQSVPASIRSETNKLPDFAAGIADDRGLFIAFPGKGEFIHLTPEQTQVVEWVLFKHMTPLERNAIDQPSKPAVKSIKGRSR